MKHILHCVVILTAIELLSCRRSLSLRSSSINSSISILRGMSDRPATSRTPLLTRDVHQAHRLSPHPIRFPSGTSISISKLSSRDDRPSLRTADAEAQWQRAQSNLVPVSKNGLPKLSRECLRSEIQCYGKYIVTTLAVFGLGGVLLALWIVNGR
jgi:hypothetical protein